MILGWGLDTVLPSENSRGVAFAAVITLVSEIGAADESKV